MYGELVPTGGGDPIPLLQTKLLVGRRESCDIVLRFKNVSAHHCQLMLLGGYWYVQDMNSRNGIKVNGVRIAKKRLDPDCTLSISKHNYQVKYSPTELGATGAAPIEEEGLEEVLSRTLLESAGLERRKKPTDEFGG